MFVNLYIPAALMLPHQVIGWRLETSYPLGDDIRLTAAETRAAPATMSQRVPQWCEKPCVELHGTRNAVQPRDGYVRLRRTWRRGEVVRLVLPRSLRLEPTDDDPHTVALLYGPRVLAGDLGPAAEPWVGEAPSLLGSGWAERIVPTAEAATFKTDGIVRPADLVLRPFAFQHERNTAVYFRRFTDDAWAEEQISGGIETRTIAHAQCRCGGTRRCTR